MKTLITTSTNHGNIWKNAAASRRGLTLMEILAAVFVLAFGLMAVITVLPFGVFQIERMNVADMSSACGRGAIQQIRMAEWQKPENIWITSRFDSGVTYYLNSRFFLDFYNTGAPFVEWPECQIADPFIVDPLGLGNAPSVSAAGLSNEPSVYQYMNGSNPALGRHFPIPVSKIPVDKKNSLYVMSVYDPLNSDLVSATDANRFFRWGDDTVFAPTDDSSRPALVTRSDGELSATGEFTWLYLVTPICNEKYVLRFDNSITVTNRDGASFVLPATSTNKLACTPVDNVTGYNVSVAVFHRRDLFPEPLNISIGSTDPGEDQYRPIRRLALSNCTINATGAYIEMTSANAEDLDLSSVKWILLTGQSREMLGTGGTSGTLVAQWYRVTGYDDIQPDGNNHSRRVFLVGPDWQGAKNASDNPDGPVYAILCDGVVNVFQATMPK